MNIEILVRTGYNQANRKLSLFPDALFTVTYQVSDIYSIGNTKGSYTKNIMLPDDPINRQLLGYLTDLSTDLSYGYNYNLSNNFNPNNKTTCYVIEDGIQILKGSLQLTGYDIVDNKIIINATIYADNSNFFADMNEKLLTDIDFSELSFTYSNDIIRNSWTSSSVPVYFPLIDYGNGWTIENINTSTSTLIKPGLFLKDFKPAVYHKIIFNKVVSSNGYNIDSDFIDENTLYNDLVIPYNQQLFQSDPSFIQDKIFHVGISNNTISPATSLTMSLYNSKNYTGTTNSYPKQIINMGDFYDTRALWYNGLLLNPFSASTTRNSYNFLGIVTWSVADFYYDKQIIPFNLTASPQFPNGVYDANNLYYQNTSNSIFSQKFIFNTDFVSYYTTKPAGENPDGSAVTNVFDDIGKYICKVNYYREANISTIVNGVTWSQHPGWNTGTGSIIPPNLGDKLTYCTDINGNIDSLSHWICDYTKRSNCFTKTGLEIVPFDLDGKTRYLGDWYVTQTGNILEVPTDDGAYTYPKESGDCPAWYYNDGYYSGGINVNLTGLAITGKEVPPLVTGPEQIYLVKSPHGDWYQQLSLQTIQLDADENNYWYGNSGTVLVNGNLPIQKGEKVRLVVSFASAFYGTTPSSTIGAYMPPSVGYLLASTSFIGQDPYPVGIYQNPATQINSTGYLTNEPLTQFFNEVSTDYINGSVVNFNDIIPKNWKQKDYVRDTFQRFNLFQEPSKDKDKSIIVETRDRFYTDNIIDWTYKLDISKPINIKIMADITTKKIIFTDKSDGDYYNKQYTQVANEIYGQQVFISPNQFANISADKKIEGIFSPTPLVGISSKVGVYNVIKNGSFVIPTIVSGSNLQGNINNTIPNGYIQSNYRLLIKKYTQNQNEDYITIFGATTSWYPYAGPYNDPYNPTFSCNWGTTKGEAFKTSTTAVVDNNVQTYWSNYLTELQDIDSRLIICYLFLTPNDINNFSFRNKVRINIKGVDCICYVNSIEDYVPGVNGSCKVTLLRAKIVDVPLVFTNSLGNRYS